MPVNVLQKLNASRAEIVIRLEEQVAVLLVNRASQPQDIRGRRTAPAAWSLEKLLASTPHLPHPSAMATCGPIPEIGQPLPHHPSDYTSRPPRSDKYKRITRCVDIVCWFETGQSADRVIRSDPARWRERGISSVLKPEREGADLE
ncbi:hypothetical protein J6590_097000 [Homalodisca vitripennis]|nr:hypothetical protein J6590_097000 [Homalodisca vitripennis]